MGNITNIVSPFKSIATQFVVMVAGLIIITAGVVGVLQYQQNTSGHISRETARLDVSLQKSTLYFKDVVEDVSSKVLFLAETPPIQGYIRAEANNGIDPTDGSTQEVWKSRLAHIFASMLRSDQKLVQIRLIRADGGELVRVDRGVKGSVRKHESELQNKGKSDYVRLTRTKRQGSVSLYGISLNREHGKVEVPHVPVLRSATPIYAKSGGVFGVLVINIDMEHVFERMEQFFDQGQKFYLTNKLGDYLIHPDKEKTFGFDLGHRFRIQSEFAALSSFFKDKSSDRLALNASAKAGDYLVHVNKYRFDPSDPSRYFVSAAMTPMSSLLAASNKTRMQIILIATCLAIAGAILAVVMARYLVRPLRQLSIASSQLAAGASVDSLNVPLDRNDEVGALARAFHHMATKLKDNQASIEAILKTATNPIITIDSRGIIQEANDATTRLLGYDRDQMIGKNVSMLMNMTDRKGHDQYLRNYHQTRKPQIIGIGREVEALRSDGISVPVHLAVSEINLSGKKLFTGIMTDLSEFRKIDKMKNEFVSTVSHELRTPLTSIKGSLGLLKASLLGELPDQVKSMITIAYNNADRLIRLINDILDIEKMEAGKLSFIFQKAYIAPLLERVIEANSAYADEYGAKIKLEPVDDNLRVRCDLDRIEQVLTNLLSNAAKFTPKDGSIHVSARERGDMIRVSVRDEGPGISKEFRKKIFGKFAQADSSNTKEQGGTGLGLAISKTIIEQHGGQIGFETADGKGTTFYFDLPRSLSIERPEPAPKITAVRKVLICEDDPDMATLLRLIINDMNYEVEVCATVEEAKKMLAQCEFSAMTLDLNLPDSDGVSFIKELRTDEKTKDLPILVVSASAGDGQEALKGSALTLSDWLEKPLDVELLRSAVARSVKVRHSGAFRVLFVEDDLDQVSILSPLVGEDAVIDSAQSCTEAKRALQQNEYDLVILDLMLPDGKGEDLLPLIQANGSQPPQVLVLTNLAVTKSMASKVDAALVKSQTSTEALRQQIQSLLGASATERSFELSPSEARSELEPTA